MSHAATITSLDIKCPAGWAPLPPALPYPPGWADDWDAAVAGDLAPAKARKLAKVLRRLHPDLVTEGHQMVGVWVREPDRAEVTGHVTLDWLLADPGRPVNRDYYRSLLEPDRRTGLTVFARNIDDIEVPAGPALQIQEIVAAKHAGQVRECLEYVVFPPEVPEAVKVRFVLHGVSVDDDFTFEEHALASIDTLQITVGAQE